MSAPKLREVKKLADSRAVFEMDMPLAELADLPPNYSTAEGSVHAHLAFAREQGLPSAQVHLQADLVTTCQRCLERMPLHVECRSAVLIVESEQDAEAAPAEWETFLAPAGRLDFVALVGEELLLELPIVPTHELGQCHPPASEARGTTARKATAAAPEAVGGALGTTRPFSDLRALLERGAEDETKDH